MDVYENKALFVDEFIKPMVIAMGIGAVNVVYKADKDAEGCVVWESVTVYYGSEGAIKSAVVTHDSKRAILADMLNQGAI